VIAITQLGSLCVIVVRYPGGSEASLSPRKGPTRPGADVLPTDKRRFLSIELILLLTEKYHPLVILSKPCGGNQERARGEELGW
jgi:hypothetical protein